MTALAVSTPARGMIVPPTAGHPPAPPVRPDTRDGHTAVWTGSEMIVWGGNYSFTGGRYNPVTDSWTATNTTNAPSGRTFYTTVWTGSEMIVWGGASAFAFDT